MPRTISDSLNLLKTSLGEIRTKLETKIPSGGGEIPNPLKVSEIAPLIDLIKTGAEGAAAKITVTCSEEYEGADLTFTNGGETVKGKVSGGKCVVVVEKAGTWTVTNSVDEQSLTVDVNFEEYSLNLKSGPKYAYLREDFPAFWHGRFSTAKNMVFTQDKKPSSTTVYDASKDEDNSIVIWETDNTIYVSSQDQNTFICLPNAYTWSEDFGPETGGYDSKKCPVYGYGYSYCSSSSEYGDVYSLSINALTVDFGDCVSVKGLTSFDYLFSYMSSYSNFDLSRIEGLKEAEPTSTAYMFYLSTLKTVKGLENLNTSKVKDMSHMFHGWSFETLDVSNFDMSSKPKITEMFRSNVKTIYCNKDWTNSVDTSSTNVFKQCTDLPGFSESKVGYQYAKPISQGGYFTPKN